MSDIIILAQHRTSDPRVTWQAVRSSDRGRLAVVARVEPTSVEPIVIELLAEADLRALLSAAASTPAAADEWWIYSDCGCANPRSRSWCATCAGSP